MKIKEKTCDMCTIPLKGLKSRKIRLTRYQIIRIYVRELTPNTPTHTTKTITLRLCEHCQNQIVSHINQTKNDIETHRQRTN